MENSQILLVSFQVNQKTEILRKIKQSRNFAQNQVKPKFSTKSNNPEISRKIKKNLDLTKNSKNHLLAGCTSTCSIKLSPISAELISWPFCVTIFIEHIGGGPVFAIVPAVVNMDTLNPSVTFCSPV